MTWWRGRGRRCLATLATAGFGAVALIGASPAQAADPAIHLVTPTPENTPLFTADQQMLVCAFGQLGRSYTLTSMPIARATQSLNNGVVDGDVGRVGAYVSAVRRAIRVEVPIFTYKFYIIGRPGALLPLQWPDIKQHRVAYRRGVKYLEINLWNAPHVEEVNTLQSCVDMVTRNRIDYCLSANDEVTHEMMQRKDNSISMAIFAQEPAYIYLAPQQAQLAEPLTKILRSMTSSGELARIYGDTIDTQALQIVP